MSDTKGEKFFDDIRKEVSEFSADKEVQAMLLEEKMAIFDMQMTKEEGRTEGRAEVKDVFSWLFSSGRAGDVERATKDEVFYNEVLKEYKNRK